VPSCVTNTSPADGSTAPAQTSATLTWPAAANASSYDVYFWTGAVPSATPIANVTTNSYTATGLTAATWYGWYIAPKNTSGAATGCAAANKTSFITAAVPPSPPAPAPLPVVPACVVNSSPVDGSTIASQTFAILNWPAAANADSYDVYLWTGTTLPIYPIGNVAGSSYTVGNLTAGTSYNWYVVPVNGAGAAGGCSANKTSFTTAAVPVPPPPVPLVPSCVVNTSPADGSTIASQTFAVLSWPAAANANSYDVYLWTGAALAIYPIGNVAGTSYTVGNLAAGTTYNWYIVPVNNAGTAVGCGATSKTSFTTAPAIIAPPTGTGLLGVYYNGTSLSDTPLLTRIDSTVNFDLTTASPVPGIVPQDFYSIRWTGQVQPAYSETYTFHTTSDDGIRLWVNGVQLVNDWIRQGATEMSGSINLVAGQKYDIVIEYYEAAGYAVTKLAWSSASTPKTIIPSNRLYPATMAANMETAPVVNATIAAALNTSLSTPVVSTVLSPNPVIEGSSARLGIISDKIGTAVINIFSSNGQMVHSAKLPLAVGVTTTAINTTGLARGCYFISVKGGDKPVIMKLFVQ